MWSLLRVFSFSTACTRGQNRLYVESAFSRAFSSPLIQLGSNSSTCSNTTSSMSDLATF